MFVMIFPPVDFLKIPIYYLLILLLDYCQLVFII
uniref:Uncharacterized protein n=1 Tax=Siphoviridae sp. cthrK8 TaxID=2826429 RepID=A0A8S5MZ83_9CAUD|nr:MAG TPA: hypothetical protein [Siphoviridae sp. cthrK8]